MGHADSDVARVPGAQGRKTRGRTYVASFGMYATQNERYTVCLEKLKQHRTHNDLGQVRQL
jgi:hypothetical protein